MRLQCYHGNSSRTYFIHSKTRLLLMIRALFLCIHNGARSQMAEAYLKKLGGDLFHAESAGIESGSLNPLAVEAMKQDGIDISGNKTKSVFDFHAEGRTYDYVITVC